MNTTRGFAPLSRVLVLVLLLLAPIAAHAQETGVFLPEVGKINANDPYPLDPGQWEVQPGYTFTFAQGNYDDTGVSAPVPFTRSHGWFTQVTYGLAEDVDVNLTVGDVHGVSFGPDPNGFGIPGPLACQSPADTNLGARWQFYASQDERTAAALVGYLTVPTGPRATDTQFGLSQEFWSVNPRLVLAQNWGRLVGVADVGVNVPLEANRFQARGGISANVAAGYQIGEHLKPLVELSYSNVYFDGAPLSETLSVTGGLLILVNEDFRFNLGITRTVAGRNAPDTTSGTFFVTIVP